MAEPTSADYQRLARAANDLSRAINSMTDSLRAMNTNLVALHELMKEKKDE